MKAVRTDRELECPEIDAGLRERQVDLVTLPDGIGEDALIAECGAADLLLMCWGEWPRASTCASSATTRVPGRHDAAGGIEKIDELGTLLAMR